MVGLGILASGHKRDPVVNCRRGIQGPGFRFPGLLRFPIHFQKALRMVTTKAGNRRLFEIQDLPETRGNCKNQSRGSVIYLKRAETAKKQSRGSVMQQPELV